LPYLVLSSFFHIWVLIFFSLRKFFFTFFQLHNATLFSSKLSSIYSRIGGSYLQRKDSDSTTHSNCVIFPIAANLWENNEKGKVFSGFMIRGPQHSRSPTDRINVITVELFENNEHSRFYLNHQQKYTAWYNERIIVAARRNAIMREDPCYLTFVGNALFLPSYLLGVMTLENPNILAYTNMIRLGTDIINGCGYWFTESSLQALPADIRKPSAIIQSIWDLCSRLDHVVFIWIPSHCGIDGNDDADRGASDQTTPAAINTPSLLHRKSFYKEHLLLYFLYCNVTYGLYGQ